MVLVCALLGGRGAEQEGTQDSAQRDARLRYLETEKERVPCYGRFPAQAFAAALGPLSTGRRERGAGGGCGPRSPRAGACAAQPGQPTPPCLRGDLLHGGCAVSSSRSQHGVSPPRQHPARHSPPLHRTPCIPWLGGHGVRSAPLPSPRPREDGRRPGSS